MESILQTAKNLLLPALRKGGTAADFTMGNGHDTLWFSQNLPGGTVWAFDIQPAALEATRRLLTENGAGENVRLILDSHSNLDRYIDGELDAGMFNLGYLPWADKSVTTKQETTLVAVEKALSRLKVGGVLVIVVYSGHEEGRLEGEALQARLSRLDHKKWDVLLHRLIHVPTCPYILAAERRK
ncbi:MAG: class I SAM-dependent methyltransferase [Oscillospiraceae bacterium]|nr:class I SAM-dependent methyltransferase [Oscillospiraceae bacterium]